jgi:hypothetical protein
MSASAQTIAATNDTAQCRRQYQKNDTLSRHAPTLACFAAMSNNITMDALGNHGLARWWYSWRWCFEGYWFSRQPLIKAYTSFVAPLIHQPSLHPCMASLV